MKRTWLWVAAVLQLLTATIHTVGLFVQLPAGNETEAQMMKLMSTYKMQMGSGFEPTMDNLFLSMSVSFSLLCVLAGLVNVILLKRKADSDVISGIVGVQLLIFGVACAVMSIYTFLLPIVCTALIFISLLISWILNKSTNKQIN